MAHNNLTGVAPSVFYPQLLHIGTGVFSSGFAVRLGDGTETNLLLSDQGIGFRNSAGYNCNLRCGATADIDLEFHPGSGKIYPVSMAVLASDFTNGTTTAATVTDFELAVVANALYELEMFLAIVPSTAATQPRFSLEGPTSQTDWVMWTAQGPPSVNTVTNGAAEPCKVATAWGTEFDNATGVGTGGVAYPYRATGMFKTTGSTPAVPVSVKARCGAGSTSITIKAGSVLKLRRVN